MTIEQLEAIYAVVISSDQWTFEARDALAGEIERRKHGPFTFAEARASGRPYRRLAWTESYRVNEWVTHVYVDQEETYFANAEGTAIAAFDEESAVATDYVLHA